MIKAMVKYFVEICFNLNLFIEKKRKSKTIHLFLTPLYLNYGDHAIATAEKKYLQRHFPDFELDEINYSFYQYWPHIAYKRVKREDIIIITGGGYAGDLWEENQQQLEAVIKAFPNNKIILAPQTVFYKNNKDKAAFQDFKNLLHNHRKLYFIAREKNTYSFLQNEFQMTAGEKLFLLPDFVLTLNIKKKNHERKGIAFCFREDDEQILSPKDKEAIQNMLHTTEGGIFSIRMAKDHVEIPVCLRDRFLNRKLMEYAGRELVITDRLHGMIFAAITGTPCVTLDNVSHKISGVYKDLESLSYIAMAEKPEQIDMLTQKVIGVSQDQREKELSELRHIVQQKYEEIFSSLINKAGEDEPWKR